MSNPVAARVDPITHLAFNISFHFSLGTSWRVLIDYEIDQS